MTSETQNQTTENSTELLEGVRILIDRMESNPEDFLYVEDGIGKSPRFWHITDALGAVVHGKDNQPAALVHLTAAEKTALLVAYRAMMRHEFTALVIRRVYEDKKDEDEGLTLKYKAQGRYQKAVLAPTPSHFGTAVAKQEGAMVNPWK